MNNYYLNICVKRHGSRGKKNQQKTLQALHSTLFSQMQSKSFNLMLSSIIMMNGQALWEVQ